MFQAKSARPAVALMLLVFAVAASAAVAAVFAGSSAAGPADPFVGAWVGVESPVGDGSTDYMLLGAPGPNGRRTYLAYETGATFCGGSPLSPLFSAGFGYSTGSVLTVTITTAHCVNGSPGAFPLPVDVTMTATSDGHLDAGGVIFSRIGSHGPLVARTRVVTSTQQPRTRTSPS